MSIPAKYTKRGRPKRKWERNIYSRRLKDDRLPLPMITNFYF